MKISRTISFKGLVDSGVDKYRDSKYLHRQNKRTTMNVRMNACSIFLNIHYEMLKNRGTVRLRSIRVFVSFLMI